MTSQEYVNPDPNKRFFDASSEATQLHFAIAEKALGIDTLLAARDEEEIEAAAVDSLSDDEFEAFAAQQIVSGFVPEYINVGDVMALQTAQVVSDRVEAVHRLKLLSVSAGLVLFTGDKKLDDAISVSRAVSVRGNGMSTDITQTNSLTNTAVDLKPVSTEDVEPEISLDEVNRYLDDYVAVAQELLALEPTVLRRMIDTRMSS